MVITQIKHSPKIEKKLNVAAYARVSSGKDAMLHSLSAQVSHYSSFIQSNDDWEYVGVYSDEAFTGTKDNREEFQKLLEDCRAGKINRIITKSVSRFARNTVTLLETVRELKDLGIGIYFEEQNIDTLSAEGELMLTVLASFAQEESLSASENVKWRIQNDFKQGILPLSIKHIYGYKRTADGGFEIVPSEAEYVRQIYKMFLDGMGILSIAKTMNDAGIPSNSHEKWTDKKIRYILSNEKYIGDLLLQKSFRSDHLTKRTIKNHGELPQYYVENNHEPIVTREMFEAVQVEFNRRSKKYNKVSKSSDKYVFTGKIMCSVCGKKYRRKVTTSRVIWMCSTFDKFGKKQCASKSIPDETLRSVSAEVLGTESLDEDLFEALVDKIIVPKPNSLLFIFKDGRTVRKDWHDRSRRESWTPEMKAEARRKTIERRKSNAENNKDNSCNKE